MISFSDYFQPLNFYTLGLFLTLLFSFDTWGTCIKSFLFKEKPDQNRVINWLVGLGFFSFLWFLLRFFLVPTQIYVAVSLLALDLVCLPYYLKIKGYQGIFRPLWDHKPFFLIVAFFLPAVFVKASLPPYYGDETAYHFISPADLANLGVWRFNGGLYSNLPQLFDLFFILSFALAKTYSVARLTHLDILVTAMLFAYSHLKKLFGLLPALLFVFAFFSLPQDLVLTATLGYVDVATYSFMLIGMIAIIDLVLNRSLSSLFAAAIFWGMALGTKYTSLTAFISLLPVLSFILYRSRDKFVAWFIRKNLILIVLLPLVFGGYWYIKNLIAYGNPVYPFIFPCARYASQWCGSPANFFSVYGGWTTKITLANIPSIVKDLFPRNPFLQKLILFSPFLFLFNRNWKTRSISLLLLSAIFIELLLLRQSSGFYARYHQHLQLWLLLLVVIQMANQYSQPIRRLLIDGVYLVLAVTLISSFVYTVKLTNSLGFLNWNEINYARGKTDIYDWIKFEFPRMYETLLWCENPPGNKKTLLGRFDPDMIWFEKDGFMRSFFTNCYYDNPALDGIPLEDVLKVATTKKMQFWLVTPNPCLPDKDVKPKRIYGDDADEKMIYLRRLNNLVVCHSQQVRPNLYYFDYQNLSPIK